MTLKNKPQLVSLVRALIILIGISANITGTQASNSKEFTVEPTEHTQSYSTIKLASSVLEEERELWVFLPKDYETSEEKYPVLYLLDGRRHFQHSVTAVDILQKEALVPQSIIVAITNSPGKRRRDLSNQNDQFLAFIKQEVFSTINKQFRTTGQKTLFGHSLAGYFALNVLATEPDLFDNYIAASPVIQVKDSELLGKFKQLTKQDKIRDKWLYLSLTSPEEEGKEATDAMNQFIAQMKQKTPKGLSWRYEFIPNQLHMTTPYLTLYQGLTYVFDDFRMPSFADINSDQDSEGIQALTDFYIKRAAKYSTSANVPERAMRGYGYSLLGDKQIDKAITVFESNVQNNPQSLGALNALAESHETAENISKALNVYRKALSLAKKLSSRSVVFFEGQVERLQTLVKGEG